MKRSTIMIGLVGAVAAPVLAIAQVPERPVRAGLDPAQVEAQLQGRAQARQEALAGGQNAGFRQGRGGGGQYRAARGAGQAGLGGFAGPLAGFQGGGAIPVASAAGANLVPGPISSPSSGSVQKSADPLNGLGAKVSAVLDISTAPRLLITEAEFGVSDTSELTIGQEYRDGWRLMSVNPTSITMKKGEQQRQIALNFNTGAAQSQASASAANLAGAAAAAEAATGLGGAVSPSNGAGQAGRGGAPSPGAGGPNGAAALAFMQQIDPAQLQALQTQLRGVVASLPPGVANDPRAAAALSALQSGNIGDLVSQFQGALGGAGGGPGGGAPFLLRLGPNGALPAPAQ